MPDTVVRRVAAPSEAITPPRVRVGLAYALAEGSIITGGGFATVYAGGVGVRWSVPFILGTAVAMWVLESYRQVHINTLKETYLTSADEKPHDPETPRERERVSVTLWQQLTPTHAQRVADIRTQTSHATLALIASFLADNPTLSLSRPKLDHYAIAKGIGRFSADTHTKFKADMVALGFIEEGQEIGALTTTGKQWLIENFFHPPAPPHNSAENRPKPAPNRQNADRQTDRQGKLATFSHATPSHGAIMHRGPSPILRGKERLSHLIVGVAIFTFISLFLWWLFPIPVGKMLP